MKEILTNITARKITLIIFALLLFGGSSSFAQTIRVEPKVKIEKIEPRVKVTTGDGKDTEKSIVVDEKVNISLCVSEGKLKINGWDRNEIRAFVGGGNVSFKVQQNNRQTNKPVWVKVSALDSRNATVANREECLSGDEIELDVPHGAVVNVKGRTVETKIDQVRKAVVNNVAGNIYLNNVGQGIQAATYEGDVMVENCGGAISLEATNGNIVAFDVAPSDIGDIFRSKTISGAISLERIEHRQMEIGSHSGSIKFAGELQNGGQYSFNTTSGTITLAMAETTSCKINALYGFGKFNSELNYKILQENNTSKTQSLVATIGEGDANVNLTTYSGVIRIKKQ